MEKFVVKQNKSGQFKFSFETLTREIILSSEAYPTKEAYEEGIISVRTNAPQDDCYVRNTAEDGSSYFNLKADNGQVIGTSEMYSGASAMEKGIASVKANAPNAPVFVYCIPQEFE